MSLSAEALSAFAEKGLLRSVDSVNHVALAELLKPLFEQDYVVVTEEEIDTKGVVIESLANRSLGYVDDTVLGVFANVCSPANGPLQKSLNHGGSFVLCNARRMISISLDDTGSSKDVPVTRLFITDQPSLILRYQEAPMFRRLRNSVWRVAGRYDMLATRQPAIASVLNQRRQALATEIRYMLTGGDQSATSDSLPPSTEAS